MNMVLIDVGVSRGIFEVAMARNVILKAAERALGKDSRNESMSVKTVWESGSVTLEESVHSSKEGRIWGNLLLQSSMCHSQRESARMDGVAQLWVGMLANRPSHCRLR